MSLQETVAEMLATYTYQRSMVGVDHWGLGLDYPRIIGLPSGFREYDNLTDGFGRGHLHIIGARPGHGKSALSMAMTFNTAKALLYRQATHDIPTGKIVVFSPEMTTRDILERYVSSRVGIDSLRAKRGELTDEEWETWQQGLAAVAEKYEDVLIYGSGVTDITDMVAMVEDLHHENRKSGGVALVVVDYIQVISGGSGSRYEATTNISNKLKGLAMRLDIPVVATTQFKRWTQDKFRPREEPWPQINEAKDSGAIEQDADVFAVLFRPQIYYDGDPRPQENPIGEVRVAKNRNGGIGYFRLHFTPHLTLFQEYQ